MKQAEQLFWMVLRWSVAAIGGLGVGIFGAAIAVGIYLLFLMITHAPITDFVESAGIKIAAVAYIVTAILTWTRINASCVNFSWNKKVKPEMSVFPT